MLRVRTETAPRAATAAGWYPCALRAYASQSAVAASRTCHTHTPSLHLPLPQGSLLAQPGLECERWAHVTALMCVPLARQVERHAGVRRRRPRAAACRRGLAVASRSRRRCARPRRSPPRSATRAMWAVGTVQARLGVGKRGLKLLVGSDTHPQLPTCRTTHTHVHINTHTHSHTRRVRIGACGEATSAWHDKRKSLHIFG